MKYVLELLRGSTVCNSKTEAIKSLDSYQHHRPGQPVVVLYKKGDSKRAVFAIGTETGTGDKGGGKKRYVIIGDCDGSHDITSTLSADNILLREIDFTELISEGGPGQFDETPLKDARYPGHFGFLNVEGSAFSTKIPANTTVQAAFEGILTGKISPKPIVDIEVEGTVLAHHNDTTSGTITIDITDASPAGSYDIIFTITNWDDVGSRISRLYYTDETGTETALEPARSVTSTFNYDQGWQSGQHTYTLFAEVSGSTQPQRVGTATVVVNNSIEPEQYTYTLTYDGNEPDGAGAAAGIPPQVTVESTEVSHQFILSGTPTLTGYTFRGWSWTKTGTTPITKITASAENPSVTVYAIWESVQPPVRYNITYHSNNGEGKTGTGTTPDPSSYSLPAASSFGWTKPNHTFKGWSKTEDGETINRISDSDFDSDRHLNLYAIWQINTYTLTGSVKDSNGNDIPGSSVTFDPASPVAHGTEVTAAATVPSGYALESVRVNGTPEALVGDHVTFTAAQNTAVAFTASEDTVSYYWSSEDISGNIKSKQLSDWTLFTDTHYIQEGEKLVGKYNCVLTPSTVTSVTGKVTTTIESPLVFSDYSEKALGIAILNTTGLSDYKVWCSPQSTDKDTFGAKKIEINIS